MGNGQGGERMQHRATNTTRALFPPICLSTWSDQGPWSLATAVCASCDSASDLIYLDDPDGLALCRECRSPLRALEFPELYCDLGGEG
jgi:hypothetical protein